MQTFVYDPTRSFRGWLRTLTRHAWSDFLESQNRLGWVSGDAGTQRGLKRGPARADLIAPLRGKSDKELLAEAGGRVHFPARPQTGEAFRWVVLEGLPGAEAAARLGMKVATVFVAKSKVL